MSQLQRPHDTRILCKLQGTFDDGQFSMLGSWGWWGNTLTRRRTSHVHAQPSARDAQTSPFHYLGSQQSALTIPHHYGERDVLRSANRAGCQCFRFRKFRALPLCKPESANTSVRSGKRMIKALYVSSAAHGGSLWPLSCGKSLISS